MQELATQTQLAERQRSDEAITLGELAQQPSVERAVAAVREFLGMDVAFTGRFADGEQILQVMCGDPESFGVSEGTRMPLEQTYCERVIAGRLPNLIPDVRADERAASLPITEAADVGAFVSMPLHFSDGRLWGTLCAASHEANPSLGYRELQFLHVFARIVADQLEQEEASQIRSGLELRAAAAQTLIAAVQARDSYTGEHSEAVVGHAESVARELGLPPAQAAEASQVALLHDIGKLGIPDVVLHKQGPLDEEEWELMRSHPVRSEELIRNVPGLEHLAPAVRAEHERWDGRGYPDGLAGATIPLASRITLVCDAYHAMTSDRPYRKAMDERAARAEIEANLGSQFCPTAGRALLAVLAGDGR